MRGVVWRECRRRVGQKIGPARVNKSTVQRTTSSNTALHTSINGRSWVNHNPFASWSTGIAPDIANGSVSEELIYRHCKKLDKKFGLVGTKNQAKRKHHQTAVAKLHEQLSAIYTGSVLSIYGSCLTDLILVDNLDNASDVDLALSIPNVKEMQALVRKGEMAKAAYKKAMRKIVYRAGDALKRETTIFRNVQAIPSARVPIVTGTFLGADNPYSKDGSIDFDISFAGVAPVENSNLLLQYSLVDIRAKQLMLAVKRWAKEQGVADAQNSFLSSYAWVNLAIFYLQSIQLVPNLQCPKLMKEANIIKDPEKDQRQSLSLVDTRFVLWKDVSKIWKPPEEGIPMRQSVTALLYGFLHFYTKVFPSDELLVSIKRGQECNLPKSVFGEVAASEFLTIEDPFETHDSPLRRNLGITCSAKNASIIKDRLEASEHHLRTIIRQGSVDSVTEPWLCPRAPNELKQTTEQPQKVGERSSSLLPPQEQSRWWESPKWQGWVKRN